MLPLLAVALARLCADPAYLQRRYVMSFLIASWVLLANDFAFLTIFDGSALNILQSYQLAGGLLLLPSFLAFRGQGSIREAQEGSIK